MYTRMSKQPTVQREGGENGGRKEVEREREEKEKGWRRKRGGRRKNDKRIEIKGGKIERVTLAISAL